MWGVGHPCRLARCVRLALVATSALFALPAVADTLEQALIQSYQNNPQLNAQRASARATDEDVAIQLGGYRPRVSATGSIAEQHLESLARAGPTSKCDPVLLNCGNETIKIVGVTATQTLFNGFQTGSRTRQAEAQVF